MENTLPLGFVERNNEIEGMKLPCGATGSSRVY